MTDVEVVGNVALMSGLLDRMGQGGACRAYIYSGARVASDVTPPGALVSVVYFAEPAGVVNATTGVLTLAPGVQSAVLAGVTPSWARIKNGNDEHLLTVSARLSTQADNDEELVVVAPAGFYTGALLQLLSGTVSALPA